MQTCVCVYVCVCEQQLQLQNAEEKNYQFLGNYCCHYMYTTLNKFIIFFVFFWLLIFHAFDMNLDSLISQLIEKPVCNL